MIQPYLDWLTGGHIQEVIEGGALCGHAVLQTDPPAPIVVSRYRFPSIAAYETYVAQTAPRLRADGLARFGPQTGIAMERTLGAVHEPN